MQISSSKVATLIAAKTNPIVKNEDSQDDMTLFVKQFKKFVKHGKTSGSNWKQLEGSKSTTEGKEGKFSKPVKTKNLCYNYRKPGYFIKECPYPEA